MQEALYRVNFVLIKDASGFLPAAPASACSGGRGLGTLAQT